MQLVTTRNFNGVQFNCYQDGIDHDDFWATREQIGQLLGYAQPREAIGKIHARNRERLNKFSGVVKLGTPSGVQDTTVYNFRGLLEICRWSNQPKADAVMDFLYDIAEEIRKQGFYATPSKVEDILADPDNFIKILQAFKQEQIKNEELKKQIDADKPKVIFAEAVDASKESILIGNLAKLLCQNGIKVGQNRLFEWLRGHGYLMNCKGERWNLPLQAHVDSGLFELKKTVINNPDGTTKITHTTKVTGKGQIYFINGFLSGKFVI